MPIRARNASAGANSFLKKIPKAPYYSRTVLWRGKPYAGQRSKPLAYQTGAGYAMSRSLNDLSQNLRRAVGLCQVGHAPDAELVERFVTRRDESAFEEMVRVH